MIHTDEDDEFARIEHEAKIRQGQPYHYEMDAIQSAIRIEREECARLCEELADKHGWEGSYATECAEAIRSRTKK